MFSSLVLALSNDLGHELATLTRIQKADVALRQSESLGIMGLNGFYTEEEATLLVGTW